MCVGGSKYACVYACVYVFVCASVCVRACVRVCADVGIGMCMYITRPSVLVQEEEEEGEVTVKGGGGRLGLYTILPSPISYGLTAL